MGAAPQERTELLATLQQLPAPYAMRRWPDQRIILHSELLNRRGIVWRPTRGIPRCRVCSHGTERLFMAYAKTHNIVDRYDEPLESCALCVSCWSACRYED